MSSVSNPTTVRNWRLCVQEYTSFAAICLIPVIYFSAFLTVVVSAVVAVGWLLSGQFKKIPEICQRNPVAIWAILILAAFLVGFSYGDVPVKEAFSVLKKYRKFLYIVILLPFFSVAYQRDRAWQAFAAISVAALMISYLMDFGILGLNKHGDPSFKGRITHSIFIGFFAFYCMHKSFSGGRYALLYLFGFCASLYNVFFVVQGRTGQLIIVLLILLFGLQRLSKKYVLGLILLLSLFLGLFANFSEKADRIHAGINYTQNYFESGAESLDSMSQRYTFWKYSLQLMVERPWFGHGTGSFSAAYERVAKGEFVMTVNPHNEFLMIGVQLGLFGLLFYLGFLISILVNAQKLPNQEKWLAQGLWVCLVTTSLFNSPLFDLAEGFWFITMIALCFASIQPKSPDSMTSC